MKSKHLLLLMLLALFAPWAAMAQQTLTVYDGTNENTYVPFYGLYADDGVKCEFVIPADQLESMANGTISSLKFYLKSVGTNTITPSFTVFVKEVESTTLTAFTGTTGATTVFNNSITFTKNTSNVEIDIPFSSDYSYGGGNLLIGIYQDVALGSGNYTSTTWYGVTQSYNSAWSGSGNGSGRMFLPKTTFTYEPAQQGGDVCEKPATLVAENVTGNSATLTWTGGSGTYNVEVKGGSYADWTSVLSNTNLLTTPLSNLTAVTDYQARVQSVCDGDTPTSGWKTVSFTTPCGAIAPGYTCGFEGPNTGGTTSYPLPACWTRPSGTSTSYPVVYNYNYYAHQGNYSLRFYGSTTSSSQIAVLPEIEGGVEGKRLTFYAQVSTAGSYSMSVGYMTNPDNASTFVEVESITPSTSYSLYTIDFGSYTDNPSYIAIKSNMSTYYTFYVDDLALSLTPTCLPPTDLAAHNTTINSAKLSWTTHTSEQAWTVYYKTTDAANYTAQAVTTNPYTLGNLAAGTNYQYYVVANCDVDDASEPSDECYFKTNCEAETVTNAIEENFDSYTGVQSGATNNLPQCWNYINTSTYDSYNGYPVIYNYASGSHSGSNHLRLYSYFSSSNSDYDPQDQYAIMPPMEDISTLRIKLYARKNSASYDATFHVGVMTDPTDASTFVEIGTGYAPTSTTYELFTIPFDNYTGQGSFIAFKIDAANSSYSTRSVFIDDITVEPIPGCMEPSDLAVAEEEGNPTSTSVKLQWTAGGSETNWKLQYKKASATEWIDLAETVTTNPYTLQGLDPSSTYNVRVAAWCDPTNPESVSPWSEAISFNTDCDVVSTFPWMENFEGMTDNTVPMCWDNSASTSSDITSNPHYLWGVYSLSGNKVIRMYNYYAHSGTAVINSPTITLPAEGTYELTFDYAHNANCGAFKVNISEDGGTTFTEKGSYASTSGTTLTEATPISLAEYAGKSIIVQFFANANYGQGAIYVDNIGIHVPPTCIKPSALKCDSKTAHTATLSWTNGEEGQNAWQIAYSTTSDFNPDEVTPVDVTTNPATIEGLSQSTTYYAYVRANCGSEDGVSAWCNAKVTFTTLAGNVTPTGLAVAPASITSSQATASWNAVAGNTLHESYDIYYATSDVTSVPVEPADPNLISGITATSQVISGLNPETSYKVWVRDYCGTDGYSNWSSAVTFSTVSACQTPDGLAESNVTNNSATITWNTYGLTDFNLRYSTDGTTWTTVENVNSPYTFPNNLTANTAYQVQVQATCADDETWSTVLNFRTECDAITITDSYSWTENFEAPVTTATYNSTGALLIMPYCWDNYLANNSSSYAIPHLISSTAGDSYNFSNPKSQVLFFYGQDGYAALPEFTNALNKLQISFKWAVESKSYGTLKLGYITDEDNGTYNTFQSIKDFASSSATTAKTMEEATVYLENVPATATRLVFLWTGTSSWYCNIDDVEVALLPSCYPVGTLAAATDVTATSAKLSWALVDDTQDAWQVCLNGDESNLIEATTHENFLLENLSPGTAYTVKVRANCGDSQGEWSNEISFTTLEACPAPTNLAASNLTQNTADLTWTGESDSYNIQYRTAATMADPIFSEDFSNGIGNWTMVNCPTTTGVSSGTFRFHWNTNPPQYLISPEISGITSNAILEFVYYNNSTQYEETFKVGLSSTDNSTASFSWSETLAVKDQVQHTYHATVPAGTKYMAIQLLSNDQYYLYIDDIVITNEIPAGEWQPTTPINTTESTATITGLTAGTEYEVQVQGVCNNVPGNWANATFTTMAEGNKVFTNATTDGKWGTADNWVPAGAPALTDEVIIRANATIDGDAAAKKITFEGTPTPTLTIADGGKLMTDNNVTATVKKNVASYGESTNGGYVLLTSPIGESSFASYNPATAGLITANEGDDYTYDLYKWLANPSDDNEWRNYRMNSFNLYHGEGYLYANKNDVELTFTGTVQANNVDVEKTGLDYGTEHFQAWNLYGNPFMCDAYLNDATSADMAFYRMNTNGDGFTAAIGAIRPMEGVFVQTSAASQGFKFSRTQTETSRALLNVNLTKVTLRGVEGSSDNAIIRFDQGGTLEKFSFREDASKVYIPQDNIDYAVVSAEAMGELPVNFRANENGSYTLSFTSEEVSFSYLHLIDNMTGNDVDLLQTPSYTFDALTTDYESRFKLVFATGNAADDSFAFYSNGNWIINNDGQATLQVIDVTGRILSSETVNGSVSTTINAAPGVYMLRLVNGDNVKVQKVVVR